MAAGLDGRVFERGEDRLRGGAAGDGTRGRPSATPT